VIHKFKTIPSLSWLSKRLQRHCGQRFEFQITESCAYHKWLSESGFDPSQPILCNGIYSYVFKRPKDWKEIGSARANNCEPYLFFRDCLFKQGDKVAFMSTTRTYNKRRYSVFRVDDFATGELSAVCRGEPLAIQ
jgi:hypothetical protein